MLFEETIDKAKALTISPIVLAFIGDAVYSLYVREHTVMQNEGAKSGTLSKIVGEEVSAKEQARLSAKLLEVFTEEESAVFRRARNAKKPTRAKHSTVSEYNRSTGLEAVIGYLYLIGETDRLKYLLGLGEER